MYLECCEGKLNAEWKIEKPMSFWRFREKLSEQMLAYNPINRLYPGDQNMRVSTQQKAAERSTTTDAPVVVKVQLSFCHPSEELRRNSWHSSRSDELLLVNGHIPDYVATLRISKKTSTRQ
jgi:hypothetical protein